MLPEIKPVLSNHDIMVDSLTGIKVSALADKFAQMKLPAAKCVSGLLSAILQDTKERDDILSNLDFIIEMASHPKLGLKDILFSEALPSGKPGLQDFVHALIRHQISEKKIDADSLAKVQSKKLSDSKSPAEFILYCNAARTRSSTVVHNKNEYVDSCPICIENFKTSGKKVWFWRNYYLFGNHAPIVPNHLMITYKKHGLQSMDRQFIEDIIDLNFMFENSRPYFNRPGSLDKHRHVQAFSGKFPIEDIKLIPIGRTGVSEFAPNYPATGFVVEGKDKKKVSLFANKIMELCDSKQKQGSEQYIPFYLVFAKKDNIARVFIFPKFKWKANTFPKDINLYNGSPEGQKNNFIIIPASVETAGRGSTSDLSTFERMTYSDYCNVLKDTSVPTEELQFIRDAVLKGEYNPCTS